MGGYIALTGKYIQLVEAINFLFFFKNIYILTGIVTVEDHVSLSALGNTIRMCSAVIVHRHECENFCLVVNILQG